MKRIITTLALLFVVVGAWAQQSNSSAKRERNYIKEGNELYNNKRYAEAEIAYRKALQENANSETAMFNLASTLLRQVSRASGQEDAGGNKIEQEALQMLQNLTSSTNSLLAEKSLYNLGNVAFNKQQYQQSIDLYKSTLRKNPDNDKARENLRLAQLKLQEQQNQDQNQDQQNQDQQQQNQDQQQQNQDQQQDQKQDQDQQQDQNQDQQQDQQNQQQQNQDQQQQQQDQNGISDRNAEQILKAMENQENATRKKIDAQKAKEEKSAPSRYRTDKPW